MTTGTRAAPERLDPALLKLAGVLVAGALAPLLDSTIVNVAVARLGRDLHAPVATIQWVITAYLLALGMAIPLTGWAEGRFGARRMWLFSLGLFLLGSVLCGLAWNVGSLIAFRVVQGAGGGLMMPVMQTLLMRAAGGRQIGRLMAAISMPALVGPILGPVIGGLIAGNASWRWIFYVNVPLCIAALALAWRGLPDTPPRGGVRPDITGMLLLSPALAALIYGLSQVNGGFGRASVLVPLVAGALLLAAFIVHAVRTPSEPAIDLRLFRKRAFAASAALLFLSGLSLFGAMLLLPLYYQQVRGHGVVEAGLLLAPQGLGSLLVRTRLGALTDRLGPRPVVLVCLVLTVLGTLAYAEAGPHTSEWLLGASLVVRGAGLGGVTLAVMTAAYQGLGPAEIPHASSATRIIVQIGGSFGAAVLAVVLQHQLSGGATPVTAYAHAFWWSLAFTALAAVPALFLAGPGQTGRSPAGSSGTRG
ncbi:MDR family MFS transporter [Actinomadura opuntiae]|uniref:MDR family MFS transporter n=1 Tax=Actinomadura sp. OS1-43 TaxID=604315 RepID=UPI00255AA481|nr:MDR family MFS transporter [Actinomadura sp. OS1-43]MDL4821024.1 MDR family MFS transporter [Actinomadura sp. OS1-43]